MKNDFITPIVHLTSSASMYGARIIAAAAELSCYERSGDCHLKQYPISEMRKCLADITSDLDEYEASLADDHKADIAAGAADFAAYRDVKAVR